MIPSVAVPQAVVLEASLYVEYYPKAEQRRGSNGNVIAPQEEGIHSHATARIYIEHDGKDLVTFPSHGMRGRLLIDGKTYGVKVRQSHQSAERRAKDLNVVASRDGIIVSGPGTVHVDAAMAELSPIDMPELSAAEDVTFKIELDVLHVMPARSPPGSWRLSHRPDSRSTSKRSELFFQEGSTTDLEGMAKANDKYGLQMDFDSLPQLIERFGLGRPAEMDGTAQA